MEGFPVAKLQRHFWFDGKWCNGRRYNGKITAAFSTQSIQIRMKGSKLLLVQREWANLQPFEGLDKDVCVESVERLVHSIGAFSQLEKSAHGTAVHAGRPHPPIDQVRPFFRRPPVDVSATFATGKRSNYIQQTRGLWTATPTLIKEDEIGYD